jgi:hypothetical protein
MAIWSYHKCTCIYVNDHPMDLLRNFTQLHRITQHDGISLCTPLREENVGCVRPTPKSIVYLILVRETRDTER